MQGKGEGGLLCAQHSFPHLLGIVPREAELAWRLAPSIFAAIEVHAPGTTEGEGGTTGVGVFALASAGPAAMHKTGQACKCDLSLLTLPCPCRAPGIH